MGNEVSRCRGIEVYTPPPWDDVALREGAWREGRSTETQSLYLRPSAIRPCGRPACPEPAEGRPPALKALISLYVTPSPRYTTPQRGQGRGRVLKPQARCFILRPPAVRPYGRPAAPCVTSLISFDKPQAFSFSVSSVPPWFKRSLLFACCFTPRPGFLCVLCLPGRSLGEDW